MRTEKNVQAVDPWCARRTLQTVQYMNTRNLRINQSFLKQFHEYIKVQLATEAHGNINYLTENSFVTFRVFPWQSS